jgi:hypothetical protein
MQNPKIEKKNKKLEKDSANDIESTFFGASIAEICCFVLQLLKIYNLTLRHFLLS